ncbi:hypothetical protein [Natrarchaeobius oligotrophus]|uniref:DUF2800 domain-containing protein n=1 Tax=Natrarchaeobius chitinivorans TaxID=1679083 RepID=A0A3N6MHE0_NATCH|nr:hypothetical protein [Natrarchaeobius chitinivorans]RQG95021.1 hypothetical protein EA472_21925 [Natrarchaeobius chitinivorans]
MRFDEVWHTLLEELDASSSEALTTPTSRDRFRVTDVQEHRVVIEFVDGKARPLQREQFETLFRRIADAEDGFELDRLPPEADVYAAVLGQHPELEIGEDATVVREVERSDDPEPANRTEPDLDVYADALLLVDALERHDVTALEDAETETLVNLYTLCSDVQRNANDLRTDVSDVLLERLSHDRPVRSSYGSVQRTSRRTRSLKDDETVRAVLADAGIDPDRVTSVDPEKVDDALAVSELTESDVYDVDEREYVRKAEVDDERKETRLQGLKDQLAASDDDEADELRAEIEALEARIEELTGFESGSRFRSHSSAGR